MGKFIAEQTIKQMLKNGLAVKGADVLVLGMTFKEDCPDLRNSKVIDVIRELESFGVTVHVHDPIATSEEAVHEYGVPLVKWEQLPRANAIVCAVAHKEYKARPMQEFTDKLCAGGVFVDVKGMADIDVLRSQGINTWRL